MCSSLLLLRGVRITPVMRGHRLGAWAAAQAIAALDDGNTLVATKAAPLARRDAVATVTDHDRELTPAESHQWKAAQNWLARHWQAELGLTPLPDEPTVLTWPTMLVNPSIDNVLSEWA